VARFVDPGVLRRLVGGLRQGAVLVTGTNGKTTTARLIGGLLEGLPARVVANRSGANLIYGITAASVAAAGRGGRLDADWAVFEIDENTLPVAVEEVCPRAVVVGNLFRDQLDRYGELESTARTIQRALERLPAGATAVLNADDPRVGEIGLGLERPPLWYGLNDPAAGRRELPHAADAITCPRCGSRLRFEAVYVGHDGDYACPNGHFSRPPLDVAGHDLHLDRLDSLALTARDARLRLPLGGLYNAYNLVAAFATGTALGLAPAYMGERLARAAPAFGRLERIEVGGRRLTLLLAKNPAGFNAALSAAVELAGARCLMLALNDRIADGRDVSWIWDVDFEVLEGRADHVIVAGLRAHDMALRLKYAEIAFDAPPEPDFARALDRLLEATPEGGDAYALCTYTAMLDLRQVLVHRRWVAPYWAT
jgi:UDP-N-acetylmuramyl tripeptide synthase